MSHHPLLQPFGEDIWLMDGDEVHWLSIPFRTRSVIVRLPDGGLWMHSPVEPTEARRAAVKALGELRHLVAPNKAHHLFVPKWQDLYPEATTWAGPGLRERIEDVDWDRDLGPEAPPAWAGTLDQAIFGGTDWLPEAMFFHRASKTLILTDIIQNHDPEDDNWFWRWVKDLDDVLGPDGGVPRDWKMTVDDRDAATADRDIMLGWPFEQVTFCHGDVFTENARERVKEAFVWLDGD